MTFGAVSIKGKCIMALQKGKVCFIWMEKSCLRVNGLMGRRMELEPGMIIHQERSCTMESSRLAFGITELSTTRTPNGTRILTLKTAKTYTMMLPG